jgi:hypothetical protein
MQPAGIHFENLEPENENGGPRLSQTRHMIRIRHPRPKCPENCTPNCDNRGLEQATQKVLAALFGAWYCVVYGVRSAGRDECQGHVSPAMGEIETHDLGHGFVSSFSCLSLDNCRQLLWVAGQGARLRGWGQPDSRRRDGVGARDSESYGVTSNQPRPISARPPSTWLAHCYGASWLTK